MAADFTLTDKSREFFYGHLLGDGCLSWWSNGKKKRYYIAFSISSKHEEYIYYIMDKLTDANIPFKQVIPRKLTKDQYTWYNMSTCMFVQDSMKNMRTQWYEQEHTSLPNDFYISKNILRTFYIDDGYINYRHENLIGIALNLEDMNYEDTRKVADLIAIEIGCDPEIVKVNKKGHGFIIRINSKSIIKKFFDYIGECPAELYKCFRYKWPYNDDYYNDWRVNPIGENRKVVIN